MLNMNRQSVRLVATLIAGAVVLVIGCRWDTAGRPWPANRQLVPSHLTFPGDCSICHTSDDRTLIRENIAFDHKDVTGVLLEGAHANAACLLCHNDKGPVQTFAERGCRGCHADPHASALGSDCRGCHEQTDWQSIRPGVEHVQTRFHDIPAHAQPPCQSCHVRPAEGPHRVLRTQCANCH